MHTHINARQKTSYTALRATHAKSSSGNINPGSSWKYVEDENLRISPSNDDQGMSQTSEV